MHVRTGLTVFATLLFAAALTACAPHGVSDDGGDALADTSESATTFTWTAESDCAACHETEGASMADAGCEISASHGDLDCVSCHTDTAGLETAHGDVDMADYKVPSKLRKTEVDPAACESCHTLSEVATKTADLSLLTDDNGKTVNPHDMPETEQHENVTCASCHDMHSSS